MSHATNSEYRSTFEFAPNPICVIRDGKFVDCNEAMLDLFGLRDKSELIGRRPGETFSPKLQSDGEMSRLKAEALLQRCVDEGRASFAWTSRRPDGDLLSVHVSMRVLDDSRAPPIVVYVNDISQLKASQQAALNRKAYLQELLESSPIAFMVSNLDTGRICKINRAARAMLGLSEQAWETVRVADLLATPSDRIRYLRRLREHGEASGEVVLKRQDGTLLHSEVTWRYNPGNRNELLCWGMDITEFKGAQRELERSRDKAREADNAKSEFLSRMSHELRTPMNAILGFGQLLQLDHENLTVQQNDAVRHILSAGEHLLELIKDVLDFSRVNSGHARLRIQRIQTLKTLQDSIALIRPLANQYGISVSAETASLPDVLADAHWLQQVLVNLLSNAIKYNSPGGTASVSSDNCSGGKVRIHVRDSGEGIRPQDIHRLFRPFERVSVTYPEIEGTGIGLALSKQIIELMGGDIGFESELGKGSDFWIELCAFEDPDPREAGASATPFKILYIEERLSNIGPMVEMARRVSGCELITATDAQTGIALARSALPDLVVMDVGLQQTGGVNLVEQLKGESARSDLPVYGLVSDADARHAGEMELAAFTQLLSSPPRSENLIQLIEAEIG